MSWTSWTSWMVIVSSAVAGALVSWAWLRARVARASPGAAEPHSFIAEQLPLGVLLFADDGRIQYANPVACELLFQGQAPDGRNFLQLLSDAPAAVTKALTSQSDSVVSVEHDGEQQSFQLLRRSVSFRESAHTLLLLNPMTAELARREIDLLKKVISVINHELNNSLASMSSLIGSGRYILEHPEQLPNLGRVLDGIEGRTTHLTQFLREYAKLSKLPLPRSRRVRWQPLLSRLQQLYPSVQIGTPPEASGWFDEVQLEQALLNLIKNALEAGGAAEQVRLLVKKTAEAIEITVLDRGSGFSAEALQHGLLPFYSTKASGSGVGLALCREVASGHGGALKIKAREGGGSSVCLSLPRESVQVSVNKQVALTLTRT